MDKQTENVETNRRNDVGSGVLLGIVNNQKSMNQKYMIAIKATAESGVIVEGNSCFNTDEPLNAKHLEMAKEKYCELAAAQGVICKPDKAVIYALMPLDA